MKLLRYLSSPAMGTAAGCEQGYHAWQDGQCIYCGEIKPGSRAFRRQKFRRHYRELMRTASLDYRKHMRLGTPHDREIAAAFLCTAVMWRKLSHGSLL
jgi:hypothetical protein